MADRLELARLRISPSWGTNPLPVITLKLVRQGEEWRIEATEQTGRSRKSWRVGVASAEVDRWLGRLRGATVPAFPVSPMVCDGEYVELTVHGEFSDLTLGWWTAPPEGADALADFALWLQELALPEEDESGED